MTTRLTIAELNHVPRESFQTTLGFLFEHASWIIAVASRQRPFDDRDDLYNKLITAARVKRPARQVALIQSYPDLADRAAIAGELSVASTQEHASAGLDQLTPEEHTRFQHLNSAYRERFGFPFIVCAREHTKDTILASFERRLTNERDQEIQTALAEIAKIARLRLADVVQP